MKARVPLPIIGKLLGWSVGTLSAMAVRYGHFSLTELREAMNAISRPAETVAGSPNTQVSDEAKPN